MGKYICIDIGGTSIKYGIINGEHLLLSSKNQMNIAEFITTDEIPTEAKKYGGPGIMRKMEKIIENYLQEHSICGICISTAGMVDCTEGKITHASSLIPDYTGMEIKKLLEDKYQLPCEVENDVNCAGLAENFSGASKGSRISVCLTIGTGIGGAIIIDNKVFHGFSGSGCEVGYMHLPGGEFQDLGASSILVRKTAEYKNINPDTIDGKYVFENAKKGDEDCIRAIDEMADVLGMGIANICYVVNPEVVVLGGGIMAQRDYLYNRIRKSIDKYLIPSVAENTKLAFAENRNNAGMLGAFYNFCSRHTAD